MAGYAKVPAKLATKMKADALYNIVKISKAELFKRKDRAKGNPDLLDDSEAIAMEKT